MAWHWESGVMVFTPTWEEFRDFPAFISYMEEQGAHHCGVAKVIPPKEWSPASNYDKVGEFNIDTPVSQFVNGQQGVYQLYNIQKKGLSFQQFKELAESKMYLPPKVKDNEELERKFWKNISFNQPLYGADIAGSLYDPGVKEWNINRLGTILDEVEEEYGVSIPGVNTAYLYFGMWKTSFAWHTEDVDLYSINYLHFGAPKQWYAVSDKHTEKLERVAKLFFPECFQSCSHFLRHKMTILSPSVLRQHSIPVNKVLQEAGNFIITFPYGYHSGFNHGLNCAESTNFASLRWIDFGKRATRCTCRKDIVQINMDVFVQKYQPDQWAEFSKKDDSPSKKPEQKPSPRKRRNGGSSRPSPAKKAILGAGKKEAEPVEPEWIEKDWTDRFNGLWHSQPAEFVREQAFNKLMSHGGSQCCICSLFETPSPFAVFSHQRYEQMVHSLRAVEEVMPSRHVRSLKVVVQREMVQLPPSLEGRLYQDKEEEEGSQLLTCSICNITVHKSCYGVKGRVTASTAVWRCRRCEKKDWTAECNLCLLRGGALKATADPRGSWCHVVCAVTVPEVVFGKPDSREPIILSSVPRFRQRLRCEYCSAVGIRKNSAACVKCIWPKCSTAFHVTCAQYRGMVPQQLGSRSGFSCHLHTPEEGVSFIAIAEGDRVYSKLPGSRCQYGVGVVKTLCDVRTYEVQFEDGTICGDLSINDIICQADPELGCSVEVRWSRRLVYSGHIIGFCSAPQYTVLFDNGVENTVTEEDIYSITERLPRRVKDKLKNIQLSDSSSSDGVKQ